MKPLGDWIYLESDRLGGGGYSNVYRCHRPNDPSTSYAIKVLKNPKHVKTLQRELDALNLMAGCPGVPHIEDYGRNLQGQLCLVMTLMPGVRLDQEVRKSGPLNEYQALEMARDILAILQVAHSQDLLHKDLTPGNILIHNDSVSLIDWGVSEPLGNGSAPHLRSKLEYCAPELFFHQHSMKSDFYSLACVILFSMTGRKPYHFDQEAERAYLVLGHVMERPLLPITLSDGMKKMLCNWLSKAPQLRRQDYSLLLQPQDNNEAQSISEGTLNFREILEALQTPGRPALLSIPYANKYLSQINQ